MYRSATVAAIAVAFGKIRLGAKNETPPETEDDKEACAVKELAVDKVSVLVLLLDGALQDQGCGARKGCGCEERCSRLNAINHAAEMRVKRR